MHCVDQRGGDNGHHEFVCVGGESQGTCHSECHIPEYPERYVGHHEAVDQLTDYRTSGRAEPDPLVTSDRLDLSENMRVSCHVLINTTPLGMTPHTDASPVSAKQMENDMVIMDAVYNPIRTRLLREAETAGCTTIDGAEMFVFQGAFQFELWTGIAAPIEKMKQTVLEALTPKKQVETE